MISTPESIPNNFHAILDKYTESGYRVIALAMRDLPSNTKLIKIDKFERHEVEKNLTLLGLIVFENRIKSETKPVIEKLHRAKVRTIMVTGNFFIHVCKTFDLNQIFLKIAKFQQDWTPLILDIL